MLSYEATIMKSIDLYEEIKERLEKLVGSSSEYMVFERELTDIYVAKMEYRGYSVRCKLRVKQLFEYCSETGKGSAEAIDYAIGQQVKEILSRTSENYY